MTNQTAVAATGTASPLEQAWQALAKYDRGSSRGALMPLDEAVVNALRDNTRRPELEQKFIGLLGSPAPAVAREYACNKLALFGSAASVPALIALLDHAELSDAARNALETLPCSEAAAGMRDRLPKLSGAQLVGAINSLGARRDTASVALLASLLTRPEPPVVSAAVAALGMIGTAEASRALQQFLSKASAESRVAAADACLSAAEQLLAAGNKTEALALYKLLSGAEFPKHVKVAATRGLLLAAQSKSN